MGIKGSAIKCSTSKSSWNEGGRPTQHEVVKNAPTSHGSRFGYTTWSTSKPSKTSVKGKAKQ